MSNTDTEDLQLLKTAKKKVKTKNVEPQKDTAKSQYCVNLDKEELLLKCEWKDCEEEHTSIVLFLQHVQNHIAETEIKKNNGLVGDTFVCLWRQCAFESVSSKEMVRHINFHSFHTKVKYLGERLLSARNQKHCTLSQSERNLIPEISDDVEFKCYWKDCENNTDFDSVQEYYWHVTSHTSEIRKEMGFYKCYWKNCKMSAYTPYKFKEHLRIHTREKLVGCPNCGSLFASKIKLHDHCKRLVPESEKCYQCSHCNKKFSIERLLRDHMRQHINYHKCDKCDMTCPTPSALRQHYKFRHEDVKPFKCKYCSYACKISSDLTRHYKIHLEKKYRFCNEDECDYRCSTLSALKAHAKSIHGKTENAPKYCCHMCSSRFKRGSALTRHLLKVHKFRWPSGHSRFRYKMDEDGFYRLQTIRFESLELTQELMEKDETDLHIVTEESSLDGSIYGHDSSFRSCISPTLMISMEQQVDSPANSCSEY